MNPNDPFLIFIGLKIRQTTGPKHIYFSFSWFWDLEIVKCSDGEEVSSIIESRMPRTCCILRACMEIVKQPPTVTNSHSPVDCLTDCLTEQFSASKCVHQWILCTWESSIGGLVGFKTFRCYVERQSIKENLHNWSTSMCVRSFLFLIEGNLSMIALTRSQSIFHSWVTEHFTT